MNDTRIKIGGIAVNRIGLGTNRLTDTGDNHDLLKYAVDNGLNFIDTAHIYTGGNSEKTIGNALAPFGQDLVVATKGGMGEGGVGNNNQAFIRANLEQSLQSLQTDCVTLYQVHRIDPNIPIADTMALLKTFQDEGKIQHIGLSEVSVEQIEEARRHADITSVQNHYNLSTRQHEAVVDYCTENDIIFIPYFPLRDIAGPLESKLQKIADKYRATPQQIVLAWMLKRSPVMLPIPGTLSQSHLQLNIDAAQIQLSDEDYRLLANQ